VREANEQARAFVYCEDEPGRRTTAKLLTRDEARRIAANIAKLPEPPTRRAVGRKCAHAKTMRRGGIGRLDLWNLTNWTGRLVNFALAHSATRRSGLRLI
jgi:hypothetical protein